VIINFSDEFDEEIRSVSFQKIFISSPYPVFVAVWIKLVLFIDKIKITVQKYFRAKLLRQKKK